ncbi:MAG: hypothetical protein M0038_19565 [Pseudomonadota bacterium]|jgi:hypothetical protein|nr:hypothetical protein [Pseudomonadota bacterium]
MSAAHLSLRRLGRLGVLVLGCRMIAAQADPWVPSAGNGAFDFALRQYDATQVFLPGQFGTATLPGSELRYTMLRITGVQGLGARLSLEYDLRAARVEKIRVHHHLRTVASATGVQDQEVGLNLALAQDAHFADSITLNVVAATGSTRSIPALGVGHTALEPDFQIGVSGTSWRVALKSGPRIFLDGGVAQWRAEVDGGVRLSRRLELGAEIFYVRTMKLRTPLPVQDLAEQYDLLRPGIRLKYRVTAHLKPFIEYEQDVAGEGIHAGRRISLGVTYAY